MPAKKRGNPYRRKYRKGNNRGNALVSARGRLTRGRYDPTITIIPDEKPITFKYSQLLTRNTDISGAPEIYSWFGNAPNDPDATAAGSNLLPNGYNEWRSFYQRMRCTSSKIVVKVFNPNVEPVMVSLFPTVDPSMALRMEHAITKPREVHRMYGNFKENRALVNSATTRAITGQPPSVGYDSILMAQRPQIAPTQQNPINQWYWNLAFATHNSITQVAMRFEVTIWYNCVLYDRLNVIPQSASLLSDFGSSV